jgi:hypothetical protein
VNGGPELSKVGLARGRRLSLWLPTAGIALATPFVVWFAMGDVSTGDSHLFGPYDVPSPGWVVGGMATVVALVGIGVLVLRTRQGVVSWWWWAVVVTLAGAGSAGAFGWRAATAGVGGANIGGGFAVLVGPLLISVLLVAACWLAFVAGEVSGPVHSTPAPRHALRRTWLLTLAAVLVAPALYAMLFALSAYVPGFITARQYADVPIGQPQSAVHEKLGREPFGSSNESFPPTAPGVACEYYLETSNEHSYRFCFRAGVLVSKDSQVALR